MSKKKSITAIAPGIKSWKKEFGSVENFRSEDEGKNVIVDFYNLRNKTQDPRKINLALIAFPNHKAQTAADMLRDEIIAEFNPQD